MLPALQILVVVVSTAQLELELVAPAMEVESSGGAVVSKASRWSPDSSQGLSVSSQAPVVSRLATPSSSGAPRPSESSLERSSPAPSPVPRLASEEAAEATFRPEKDESQASPWVSCPLASPPIPAHASQAPPEVEVGGMPPCPFWS